MLIMFRIVMLRTRLFGLVLAAILLSDALPAELLADDDDIVQVGWDTEFPLSFCSANTSEEARIAQIMPPNDSACPYGAYSSGISPQNHFFNYRKGPCVFDMGVLVRGYYLNDQRIQWTGNEETMGAEGILTPAIVFKQNNGSEWSAHGEFFIQDTINKNVYLIGEDRPSYRGNYDYNAFELAQLHLRYKQQFFEFRAGKFESPFGNYYSPIMSNSRWDAPFIRTESILWRDTGLMVRVTPSVFDVALALTNGCEGNDTNSMKAVIGRLGVNFPYMTMGISGLAHDGEGSEEQKQFRRHAGVDMMIPIGNWVLSSEIIYDEYGMRRDDFDPQDIFWRKSIYYRQINKSLNVPITGWGGYVDMSYDFDPWLFSVNYGEYYPEQLHDTGYPQHNIINRRVLVKLGRNFTKNVQWYNAMLVENGGYVAQEGQKRRIWAVLSGLKLEL